MCNQNVISQKSKIANDTFWCLCFECRILDLLNAIITLLCVTEFVSTENQHNASVLFIMVLAEMSDVFMVLTKHRDPKNTLAHFFHHLCAKYVSKYALQCKNYIKILNTYYCVRVLVCIMQCLIRLMPFSFESGYLYMSSIVHSHELVGSRKQRDQSKMPTYKKRSEK